MVTDQTFVQAVAFIGCLSGVVFRTLYPYFEKVQQGKANDEEAIQFLHKYKLTAVISLVIASATAMGVVGSVPIPAEAAVNVGSLFIAAFFTGYGANSILNRASFKAGDGQIDKIAAQKKAKEMQEKGQEVKQPT